MVNILREHKLGLKIDHDEIDWATKMKATCSYCDEINYNETELENGNAGTGFFLHVLLINDYTLRLLRLEVSARSQVLKISF